MPDGIVLLLLAAAHIRVTVTCVIKWYGLSDIAHTLPVHAFLNMNVKKIKTVVLNDGHLSIIISS